MQVVTGKAGDALVIVVSEPRLDAAVAISFKDVIREAAGREGSPIILDLSKVDFLDSSGLGAIVGVMKMLGPDRPMEIAGLTPGVRKLFRLTRMDTVFKLHAVAPPMDDTAKDPLRAAE
ncbi:MAG: STAS domain-containing protein [Roseinatronobacter sp.]